MSVIALLEWITRLVGTVRPRRSDTDLEQELRLHAEMAAEATDGRDQGSGSDSRRLVSRIAPVAQTMDALRDQRGVPWLDDLLRDVRYGLRVLNRQRMFAAVAVLTLAIGIGATTAVFSVVNGVLLRPLAYPEPERLVALRLLAPGAPGIADVSGDFRLSESMFFTFAEQNRAFEHVGIWYASTATVTGAVEPEEVRGVHLSHGTLQALGVTPVVGRWLSQDDQQPGGPARVMLAHGYWQHRFGGDPSVIGRGIIVEGETREIVGVMPAGFRVLDTDADLIVPLRSDRSRLILPGFGFQGIARLKPGVTLQEADADIGRMVPIWMNSWPAAKGVNPRVYEAFRITPALRSLHAEVVGNVGDVLWIVMGTIGIVLLVACANVATLLLVRAEGRQQELAVRASLGAGRGRIVRGLLLESLLLALISGVVGVALAYGGLRVLVAMGPANLPRLSEISLDLRSLAFALVISAASGLLFGLLPAFRQGGPRVWNALRGGGRTATGSRERHRARSVLVVTQVALALVLLVSSGLMIRTSLALRSVEPGFTEPASIQTVRISIPRALVTEPERVARLQQDIVDRLSALPGVGAVGYANVMHMEGLGTPWDAVQREDALQIGTEIPPMRVFKAVSPKFFAATGTRFVVGRDYEWSDLYGRRPFVIISENLARELWETPQQAMGRRLRASLPGSPLFEVIGVVQDVRDNGVHQPAPAIVYWPALGNSRYADGPEVTRAVTFGIRTSRAGSDGLLNEIKQAIWAANASLPLGSVRTMQEAYDRSMARTSFTLVMLSVAASAALVLGLVGIYGVIAYTVSQRTREVGIRLALGAQQGEVKRMFMRSGLALVAVGIIGGLAAAAALTQAMASVLFGVDPLDPVTFAAVPLVLLTAAVVASYLPARRAAAIAPVEALKAE
jgi:putative ABC transport system permease protein